MLEVFVLASVAVSIVGIMANRAIAQRDRRRVDQFGAELAQLRISVEHAAEAATIIRRANGPALPAQRPRHLHLVQPDDKAPPDVTEEPGRVVALKRERYRDRLVAPCRLAVVVAAILVAGVIAAPSMTVAPPVAPPVAEAESDTRPAEPIVIVVPHTVQPASPVNEGVQQPTRTKARRRSKAQTGPRPTETKLPAADPKQPDKSPAATPSPTPEPTPSPTPDPTQSSTEEPSTDATKEPEPDPDESTQPDSGSSPEPDPPTVDEDDQDAPEPPAPRKSGAGARVPDVPSLVPSPSPAPAPTLAPFRPHRPACHRWRSVHRYRDDVHPVRVEPRPAHLRPRDHHPIHRTFDQRRTRPKVGRPLTGVHEPVGR